MRTLITLLLLVCFGTTQAAAVDCPMAAAPAGQSASSGHGAGHHPPPPAHAHHGTAHAHPADAPSAPRDHGHDPLRHATTGCGIAMACGISALPSAHPLALSHVFASAGSARVAASEYASHHPATEPPPPRHPSA